MVLCSGGGVSTTVKWLIWARNGVWENRQQVVLQRLGASGSKITVSSCWGEATPPSLVSVTSELVGAEEV